MKRCVGWSSVASHSREFSLSPHREAAGCRVPSVYTQAPSDWNPNDSEVQRSTCSEPLLHFSSSIGRVGHTVGGRLSCTERSLGRAFADHCFEHRTFGRRDPHERHWTPVSTMPTFRLALPLTHPAYTLAHMAADERTKSVFRLSLCRRPPSVTFRLLHAARRPFRASDRSNVSLYAAARRAGDLPRVVACRPNPTDVAGVTASRRRTSSRRAVVLTQLPSARPRGATHDAWLHDLRLRDLRVALGQSSDWV
jgi:hypothetical protein